MKASAKGYVSALLSGALFGVIPILILNISRNGSVSNSFCIMARSFIAGVALLPVAFSRIKKHPPGKKGIMEYCFFSTGDGQHLYSAFYLLSIYSQRGSE